MNKELIDRLEKENAQLRKRLFEAESGRAIRIVKGMKRTIVDPKWAISSISRLPEIARSLRKPAEYSQTQPIAKWPIDRLPPLPVSGYGSKPKYPNLKVLSFVENMPFLGNYCHHIRFLEGGDSWKHFKNIGFDAVIIDSAEQIKQYEELGVNSALPGNTCFINTSDRNIKNAKNLQDVTWFDSFKFNPSRRGGSSNLNPMSVGEDFSEYNLQKELANRSIFFVNKTLFKNKSAYIKTVLSIFGAGSYAFTQYSDELIELLPKDAIQHFFADSLDQVSTSVDSDIIKSRTKITRFVHNNHSSEQIADEIAKHTGFVDEGKLKPMQVSVALSTNRPEAVPGALDNIFRQNYQNLELILVLHGRGFDHKSIKDALDKSKLCYKIVKRPTNSVFGENLNLAVSLAEGELFAKMDDDDYYGKNHILDLVTAFKYSGATIVGKRTNITHLQQKDLVVTFSGNHEEEFTHHLPGATILGYTKLFKMLKFGRVKRAIDSELYRRLEARGGTLYSTHAYNFVRVRHGDHTYKVDDEDFIANSTTKPIRGFDKSYWEV